MTPQTWAEKPTVTITIATDGTITAKGPHEAVLEFLIRRLEQIKIPDTDRREKEERNDP